jgi:hypothetical protein
MSRFYDLLKQANRSVHEAEGRSADLSTTVPDDVAELLAGMEPRPPRVSTLQDSVDQ